MNRALDVLRPHPHRGDVIAAGAVPLAIAALLIDLRMTQWALGVRFVVVALLVGLILVLGWLAALERETPRTYHSVLLVAALLPLIFVLIMLAEILGADRPPGAGGIWWTFAAEAVAAALAARRANSAICTLIAALAAAVAVEAFIVWAFKPHDLSTLRAVLFALTLVFAFLATRLRDRRRRHAVQFVNAAGLMAVALALTYLVAATALVAVSSVHSSTVAGTGVGAGGAMPFGWKLYLLLVGFALVAYAGADREPGPAYIGVVVLVSFVLFAGLPAVNHGSVVGWPLFLLLLAAAALAIGLRPLRPLPPPPDAATTAAPTVPLRTDEPGREENV